jgi:hypothetical protein
MTKKTRKRANRTTEDRRKARRKEKQLLLMLERVSLQLSELLKGLSHEMAKEPEKEQTISQRTEKGQEKRPQGNTEGGGEVQQGTRQNRGRMNIERARRSERISGMRDRKEKKLSSCQIRMPFEAFRLT